MHRMTTVPIAAALTRALANQRENRRHEDACRHCDPHRNDRHPTRSAGQRTGAIEIWQVGPEPPDADQPVLQPGAAPGEEVGRRNQEHGGRQAWQDRANEGQADTHDPRERQRDSLRRPRPLCGTPVLPRTSPTLPVGERGGAGGRSRSPSATRLSGPRHLRFRGTGLRQRRACRRRACRSPHPSERNGRVGSPARPCGPG